MRKSNFLLGLVLLAASNAALGQTTLPLNTGYDHPNFQPYLQPGNSGPVQDNYWIKVAASYPLTLAPAYVIKPHPAWQPPMTGSQWIGATTPNGASTSGPQSYTLYRKCFCLMPGYKDIKLDLKIRGDDATQVWLNSVNNNIVPYPGGGFSGPAVPGTAQPSQFHAGLNCVYVLVKDIGGAVTGFNLAGTVSAHGLMPMAAAGTGLSFAPCKCDGGINAKTDKATIAAIVNIAKAGGQPGPNPKSR